MIPAVSENEIYGYPFSGARVLVIAMAEEDAQILFRAVRGRSACRYEAEIRSFPRTVPEEIFILTIESWYAVRFHSFACTGSRISFVMYFMKAQYMATADLLKYRKKSRSADTHHREYILYSDKIDEPCQHSENGSGNDIIGIMDTAEDADEAFAGSGKQKQDADFTVDLQDRHGNDHA